MLPEEIDNALEELDNRLERLRALYEQYFLGIEKIEPTVARKDVDRRFWVLRRVQIRNTARRFKMQVLIQRYNTFQQYWARICREIENGTYSRHMLRAQKNVGFEPKTWVAKKRMGLLKKSPSEPPDDAGRAELVTRETESGLAERPLSRPPRVTLGDLDLDFDGFDSAPEARPGPPQSPARPPMSSRPPGRSSPIPLPIGHRPAQAIPAAPRVPTGMSPERPRPPAPAAPSPTAAAPKPAPAAPKPVAGAPKAPAAARGPAAKPAPTAPNGVTEQRLKELHSQLLEAKKQLNQPSTVSVDALARTLRATADKLKDKAKGRRIDFEVVVKDGQALVRPILRK